MLQTSPITPEGIPQTPLPPDNDQEGKGVWSSIGLFFLELVRVILLAGLTIGLVRYFLFKPFYVKGKSMEPSFYEHEYLIIDKITYRMRALRDEEEIRRGEVVVLISPGDPKEYYLKRVIGLPGERVKVDQNKIIIYNSEHPDGTVLTEPYVDVETAGTIQYNLSDDQYFVLGDNRTQSYDSRRFGPINRSAIVGRAWFRGWPFSRVTIFETPEYPL